MAHIELGRPETMTSETAKALNIVNYAAGREIAALKSLEEVYSGSEAARALVNQRIHQWELYRSGLRNQVLGYARLKAGQPVIPGADAAQAKYRAIIPAFDPAVKGKLFSLDANEQYAKYVKEHPDMAKALGLTRQQAATLVNYINGKRSVIEIRDAAVAEMDEDIPWAAVLAYLELLKTVKWIVF